MGKRFTSGIIFPQGVLISLVIQNRKYKSNINLSNIFNVFIYKFFSKIKEPQYLFSWLICKLKTYFSAKNCWFYWKVKSWSSVQFA